MRMRMRDELRREMNVEKTTRQKDETMQRKGRKERDFYA